MRNMIKIGDKNIIPNFFVHATEFFPVKVDKVIPLIGTKNAKSGVQNYKSMGLKIFTMF